MARPYEGIFINQVIPYERPQACKFWYGPRTQFVSSYDVQYYAPIDQVRGPYEKIFSTHVIPYERPQACKPW